jgi:hypothetical protein
MGVMVALFSFAGVHLDTATERGCAESHPQQYSISLWPLNFSPRINFKRLRLIPTHTQPRSGAVSKCAQGSVRDHFLLSFRTNFGFLFGSK